ncbi:variant erythrocyte surface antigen-1 family protein [Babesia caballi]|uniref:Variant erythrocyte surface antigen-1 family protein n=1 Tax=Babesia caballi TaxID=5871 RepID=A0AAV4LUL4_BABCB|nr:variant erythrocyte surface antigen-1 family protein [Babesia caballi]
MSYKDLTLLLERPLAAPVDPSFHCPSNLKEAIDWILRVTGKDGGTSKSGTTELAGAVEKLLKDVESSSPEIQKALVQIKGALGAPSTGLIDNLATGLATFIGYHNTSNGLIGTKGIAVSNDPLERLRDGMLGFLIGVLGELKRYNTALDLNLNENQVEGVIDAIKAALGGGVYKFEAALKKVVPALGNDQFSSIQKVLQKLKAVGSLQSKGDLSGFAGEVEKYLKGVLEEVNTKATEAKSEAQTFKTNFESLLTKCKSMEANTPLDVTTTAKNGIKDEIANANSSNVSLKSKVATPEIFNGNSATRALVEVVTAGTNGFLWQLRRKYGSLYQGSQWSANGNDPQTCAKIFLSCIPFIWSGLSYLCWRCSLEKSESGFKDLTLGSGYAKDFMFTMGYTNIHQISGEKMGSDVFATAMKGFKDFQVGMQAAESKARERVSELSGSSRTPTFPELLHELESRCNDTSTFNGSDVQNNAMSISYLLAKCYFKGVHLTSSQSRGRPSTIREMLYWLAGLPFAPGYESLKAHVSGVFRGVLGDHTTTDPAELRLQVAISGSTSKGDFFSPASVTSYLTTTACTIPNTLAFLQGRSDASGPLLHGVFSNSMKFKYPTSGAALFSELCDYAYALKLHISFLHQQCKGKYSEGFGWRHCKYGQPVNKGLSNGGSVPAWICAGYKCDDAAKCRHYTQPSESSGCKHHTQCGTGTNFSPLQGFLTDTLKGFRLNSSDSISTHLDNHSPSSMCHVKMGFTADTLLNATLMGYYLYHPLNFLCGNPNTPLAKLLETIDAFLYMFRFYFFYNLSSFWLCSLAILLYFLIYGIDVLHVKSHVHLPSSHTVPPIDLLTTGKAPALTKLTYYMP